MKKIMMIALFIFAMLSAGCSQMAQEAVDEHLKTNHLENYVTTVCYDLVDKTDCPKRWYQYDINIVPFIPLSSRFCFSVIPENEVLMLQGKLCYSYDILKDY